MRVHVREDGPMGPRRTALLLVAVGAATIGVYVVAFTLDTTRDRPDTLDVQPVKGVAQAACARLRTELDALSPLPAGTTLAQRQDRLAVQDRAVRALVTEVRAVGEPAQRKDVPAQTWLADWLTLADARQAYGAAGADGEFVPPSADGHPISERMSAVGIDTCVVPDALTVAP